MFLKNISINQFKSHSLANYHFSNGVNCFSGNNGAGKTNLLDAIYCLLNGRPYFQSTDNLCVQQGETYYVLKGDLELTQEMGRMMVSFQMGKRKAIKYNDETVGNLGNYFGKHPTVVIAPNDVEIINGESEQRRRFFDYMLSVVDADYLKHLLLYSKVLDARNKQLKLFLEKDSYDAIVMQYYDETLERHGTYIFEVRQRATVVFEPFFNNTYAQIAGKIEAPVFTYASQLHGSDFKAGFTNTMAKDRILGRTGFGIHRDDWIFDLHGMPLKKTGSQGQIKSFLIALKLAMYNFILEKRAIRPVLLLDDIFEKIDSERMQHLVEIICQEGMGQVFITHTNKQRVEEYFEGRREVRFFELV